MEQRVKVVTTAPDGTARVMVVRESACSGDCHKCSGCGAVQQTMLLTARNPIGARKGDVVTVTSDSGPVLKAAAVLYLLPLVLFIAAYLAGMPHQLGGLTGALGFAVGIGIAIAYDRLVVKKKKTDYTISGFVRRGFTPEYKGDNELD